MKSVFPIFFFLFLLNTISYSNEIAKVKYLTFTLEFKEANHLIRSCKNKESTKIQALYYENYIDFLKTVFSQTESSFENYLDKSSAIYEEVSNSNSNSPYYLNTLSQIKFHDAILNYLFDNTITSAWAFYNSYKLNNENLKKFPEFIENLKLYSIYNVIFSSIPNDYKWILSTFSMDSDLTTGLEGIKKYFLHYENDSLQNVESTLIYALSLMQFSRNKQATINKIISKKRYENNSFLRYFYCMSNSISGNSNKIIPILENNQQKETEYQLVFFKYLLANEKLNKLELATAKELYLEFLGSYSGINYIKVVNQRLAWISFLEGNIEKYNFYSERVLKAGAEILEKDKQSKKEVSKNRKLNRNLLAARLLFDGANFKDALIELYKLNFTELKLSDKIEYKYREARIYHNLNNLVVAKNNYKETINLGQNSKLYFAPYAAINLAEIYTIEKNPKLATFYFDLALEMNDGEYKNSIEVRAKRGKSSISLSKLK